MTIESHAEEALRAALACAKTGLAAERSVSVTPEECHQVEASRLRGALEQILMARHADKGLEALKASGILQVALPEVAALAGLGDYKERHKDVWEHTKQVVMQTIPRVHLRWAALLHDIGKARTRGFTAGGKVHFHGHPEVGARMFKRMVRRDKWLLDDRGLEQQVHFLILHHQRTAHYEPSWTDTAVRRFARDLAPQLDDIFALARADMTTKRKDKKRRMLSQIKDLRERIVELAKKDAVVRPLPKGLGAEIMTAFGLPPSRRIGDLMRALEEAVEERKIEGQLDAECYVDYLRQNAAAFNL